MVGQGVRNIGVVMVLAWLPACEADTLGPDPNAPIQTDRLTYVATYEQGEGTYRTYSFTLITHFANPTPDPIYLERCSPTSPRPIFGVPLLNPALESAYSLPAACLGHHNPIRVAPGETRTDTLRITGPYAFDGVSGAPLGYLEGRYRILFPRSCEDRLNCPLNQPPYLSNAFEITRLQ